MYMERRTFRAENIAFAAAPAPMMEMDARANFGGAIKRKIPP